MRPKSSDYASYYDRYISKIQTEDIIIYLKNQEIEFCKLIDSISEKEGSFRYAEGKWSIKELLGHIIDTERIMSYRALCIARGEAKHLPGFEHDDYVSNGNFDDRTLTDLMDEFAHLRKSNIILFRSFNAEVMNRFGTASENKISVLALLFIIAGHLLHHQEILLEKYL